MKKTIIALSLFLGLAAQSQSLEIIPLGVYGGSEESNLSAYLVGVQDSKAYLCMDAGTLRSGINKAIELNTFQDTSTQVLQDYIKGYFISHGHLDHLSGLIINSPEDSKKPIYALDFVIDVFKNNYFTNASWANFANQGEAPIIGKYSYNQVEPGDFFDIQNTSLQAKVYPLSHVNPQKSSAILVKHKQQYVLYFGDTGADRIENTNNLEYIWKDIAPLIDQNKLKNILIEVSFSNSQPENALFGHLTPKLLQEELSKLSHYTKQKQALKGLNIIVTHLKPSQGSIQKIQTELEQDNPFQVNYIFPEQGRKISL
ncbi:MBL fold metallo-hydrolase [Myroides sp. LJL119]